MQKYYESKSRQALPDGVFGHFNKVFIPVESIKTFDIFKKVIEKIADE